MAYKPTVIQPARCLRTVGGSSSSGWPLSLILRLVVVVSARFRVRVRRLAGVSLAVDEQGPPVADVLLCDRNDGRFWPGEVQSPRLVCGNAHRSVAPPFRAKWAQFRRNGDCRQIQRVPACNLLICGGLRRETYAASCSR